jgi:hypothetical protein
MRSLLDASHGRQSLQVDILKSALDWPLVDAVWSAVVARDEESTPEETREQFLKTNLAVRLAQRLRTAKKNDLARRCETAITEGNLTDARDVVERETADALEKDDLIGIANRLGNYQPPKDEKKQPIAEDADWPLLWLLRLATQLSRSGKSDKAFELVANLPEGQNLWREESYQLLAALTGKSPDAAELLLKRHRSSLIPATEKISLLRGLCYGLSTVVNAKP